MFKRKLTESDWLLLAANLAPIAGVLFAGWDPYQVFLAYCLETMVIGFLTLVKLGVASAFRKKTDPQPEVAGKPAGGIGFMLFFLVHYGLFVVIQTSLFLGAADVVEDSTFPFFKFMSNPAAYVTQQGWLVLVIFALCYAFEQLFSYFREKEFLTQPMVQMMFEPYIRIFIQQITVILGGFALGFGAGTMFIMVFAAAKIFFTVFLDYKGAMDKFKALAQK